ncbi:MAG: pilus assembly protein PilM [Planctomycetota bacterium]|nr:pilus assembly protein PilM [Planctomycetota bacterium]
MRTLLSKIDRISERFFSRSYGWTGIEIGCHCLNMAQVRKVEDRWQLAAVWTVEHPVPYAIQTDSETPPVEETFGWLSPRDIFECGLSATVANLDNLDSLFVGKNCAATLNDGLISYRELELPTSDSADLQSMVHSEIAIETECDLEDILTDCWELPQNRPRSTASSFGGVSLQRSTALVLASDLLQAGFECQILDAMPCAMARATSIALDNSSEDGHATALAIDLGYQQATITLVDDGRPILTRTLRNHGLVQLLSQIASSFAISLSDAETLLFQSPFNPTISPGQNDDFSNPLKHELNGYLMSLSNEIEKTILYANRTYRTVLPVQILLMGGGVRIPYIEKSIEQRVDLPTHLWSIDLSPNLFGVKNPAIFAIACGLSVLAWEGV